MWGVSRGTLQHLHWQQHPQEKLPHSEESEKRSERIDNPNGFKNRLNDDAQAFRRSGLGGNIEAIQGNRKGILWTGQYLFHGFEEHSTRAWAIQEHEEWFWRGEVDSAQDHWGAAYRRERTQSANLSLKDSAVRLRRSRWIAENHWQTKHDALWRFRPKSKGIYWLFNFLY